MPDPAGIAVHFTGCDFVLVHGAWCGGWIWERVAQQLRGLGHRVHTPTLSGLEESRPTQDSDIDLDTHINDITALIRQNHLQNVVLVGHSYGGMVITGVADMLPKGTISALVYLDAFVPEDGKALIDYAPMPSMPAEDSTLNPLIAPIPAAPPRNHAADCDWLNQMRKPHPLKTFTQPVKLSGELAHIPAKIYVLATGYPGFFGQFAKRLCNSEAWQCHELPCSHDIMLALPDETVSILLSAAQATQAQRS